MNSGFETTNCILAAFPMKVTTALPRTFFVQVESAPMDPEKNLENGLKVMCVHVRPCCLKIRHSSSLPLGGSAPYFLVPANQICMSSQNNLAS